MLNWTRLAPYIRKYNLTSFTLFYNLEQSLFYASWLTLSAHQPSETSSFRFVPYQLHTDRQGIRGGKRNHFNLSFWPFSPENWIPFQKGKSGPGNKRAQSAGPFIKGKVGVSLSYQRVSELKFFSSSDMLFILWFPMKCVTETWRLHSVTVCSVTACDESR